MTYFWIIYFAACLISLLLIGICRPLRLEQHSQRAGLRFPYRRVGMRVDRAGNWWRRDIKVSHVGDSKAAVQKWGAKPSIRERRRITAAPK